MEWSYGWADWPADARRRDAYRVSRSGGLSLLVPTFRSRVAFLGRNGARDLAVALEVSGRAGAPVVHRVDVDAERGGVTRSALEGIPLDDLAAEALARSSLVRDVPARVVLARVLVDGGGVAVGPGRLEPVEVRPRAVLVDDHGRPWFRVVDVATAARAVDRAPRRRRLDDAHLQGVAQVWLEAHAAGRGTTAAVAGAYGIPYATAYRWVTAARGAGLIPPADTTGEQR